MLWRDAAFLTIDEHFPCTLGHPAKSYTGMRNYNIRFVSHHAVHATDSCYRPSFEVLVVVVVVAIEVIERECLNARSVK